MPGDDGARTILYNHTDFAGQDDSKIDFNNRPFVSGLYQKVEARFDLAFGVSFLLYQKLCEFLAVPLVMGILQRFSGNKIDQFAEYEMMSGHYPRALFIIS